MLAVILMSLATYRLTRLVVEDAFPPMRYQRERVIERYGEESWQGYLVQCPWCVSIYTGGAVVLATCISTSVPLPVWIWLTASVVSGFLAKVDG